MHTLPADTGQKQPLHDIIVRGDSQVHYGVQSLLESIMDWQGVHYCYYFTVLPIPVNLQMVKSKIELNLHRVLVPMYVICNNSVHYQK